MGFRVNGILRFATEAVPISTLAVAGHLWCQPERGSISAALAVTAAMSAAVLVALSRTRGNQARRHHEQLRQDEKELAEFKQAVRFLAGVVDILGMDDEDLRHGHPVGELHSQGRQTMTLTGPRPAHALEDATAGLPAPPHLDTHDAIPVIQRDMPID